MIHENLDPRVKIGGILPTMLDSRLLHAREALDLLEHDFGDLVFTTRVRKTVGLAEDPYRRLRPLLRSAGAAAQAYRELAQEVLRDAEEAR